MSERKNIERLFQEKFKDFEETPSPKVWEGIASKLEKKENKRRVIPFWLKASGIAASLLLGYLTVDNYTDLTSGFNSTKNNTDGVVSSESSNEVDNQSGTRSNAATKENVENNVISSQNNEAVVLNEDNPKDDGNAVNQNDKSNSSNSELVSSENKKSDGIHSSEKTEKANQINTNNSFPQNASDGIANHSKHKKSKRNPSNTSTAEGLTSIPNNENQLAVQNNKTTNKPLKNVSPINKEKQDQLMVKNNQETNVKSSDQLIQKENLNKVISPDNQNQKTAIAEVNNQDSDENTIPSKYKVRNASTTDADNPNSEIDNSLSPINKTQQNAIANAVNPNLKKDVIVAKDSAVIAAVEENPLETILKEKELKKNQEKIIAENASKWKVRPNVAPLFMGANQGSPIDQQFADNTKDFENNLSVGLGLDYAFSPKFSIRTGVNKFELGYNTNDIAYYAGFSAKDNSSGSAIQTINMKPQAYGMVIEDKKAGSVTQELAAQNKDEGFLNQRFGYVEVPFEVSYKLLDKKFGIQVITGLSTLFLNENEVSVVSNGLTTVIGEANNLNKIHFSTNIGVGFKYSFWKSFEANFEPTFKYQINTFNANSGGFKPYLIGLYTGVSFKF